MNCNCKDWEKGKSAIDGLIVMGYVHGQEYDGPFWKYCPWCGKELSDTLDENKPTALKNGS